MSNEPVKNIGHYSLGYPCNCDIWFREDNRWRDFWEGEIGDTYFNERKSNRMCKAFVKGGNKNIGEG